MGDRYRFGRVSFAILDLQSHTVVDIEDSSEVAEAFALDLAAKQDRTYYVARIYTKAEPERQPSRLTELKEGES